MLKIQIVSSVAGPNPNGSIALFFKAGTCGMWRLKKKPWRLKLEQWRLTLEPRKLLQITIAVMTEKNSDTEYVLNKPDPDPHQWK
jgi:hypothetical protein